MVGGEGRDGILAIRQQNLDPMKCISFSDLKPLALVIRGPLDPRPHIRAYHAPYSPACNIPCSTVPPLHPAGYSAVMMMIAVTRLFPGGLFHPDEIHVLAPQHTITCALRGVLRHPQPKLSGAGRDWTGTCVTLLITQILFD